jgi:hypothetical protein
MACEFQLFDIDDDGDDDGLNIWKTHPVQKRV